MISNEQLESLDINTLVELKTKVENLIYNYKDGYFYICNVRSYGRNWTANIKNRYELQELCYRYDGEDGIVDVYSNNPSLGSLHNYGSTMYVPTVEDYKKWKEYGSLKILIRDIEIALKEWDNRENIPYSHRPHFAPIYSEDDLIFHQKKYDEYDTNFVAPVTYLNDTPDSDEDHSE